MYRRKNALIVVLVVVILFLLFPGPIRAEQLHINELLEHNPWPQVLKEGPVVRVKHPPILKPSPVDDVDAPDPVPFQKVALTFDDGPNASHTSGILDILKAEDVAATFFVVGNQVERHPELVERMFSEGHLIANHSRSHADLSLMTNEDIVALELDPTSRAVEKLTGEYPMMMRPPYGSLRPDSTVFLRELGWHIVRWSLDTFDWDSHRNSFDQIMNRILTQHHNGAIVLMHCNGPATLVALPEVIRTLKELGYEFVTVAQL